jgi:hypothetical protein
VDLNKEQVLANELIRKWLGTEKKLGKYCKALGQYTEDLNAPIKDLTEQLKLARQHLEMRPLSPSRSEEEGPSVSPRPGVSSEPGTSRAMEQFKEGPGFADNQST